MNFYETLEVSANASPAVIRAAYKSLMQHYHPDRHPDDAETALHASRIVQAYKVLADAHSRAAYDLELKQIAPQFNEKKRAVTSPKESETHGYLWLVMALLLAGAYFLYPFKQSPDAELKTIRTPSQQPAHRTSQAHSEIAQKAAGEKTQALADRTRAQYISNLSIKLRPPAFDATEKPLPPVARVLTIATLGVVVGSFDADKFIRHIERNRDFISQKLAEKLVDAQYDRLSRNDAELYLKTFILDALNEITQTNRSEDYPPTKAENPGRYGVIDVSLPESFSVK